MNSSVEASCMEGIRDGELVDENDMRSACDESTAAGDWACSAAGACLNTIFFKRRSSVAAL